MVGKDIITILKLAHAGCNTLIFIGFLVQSAFGFKIRAVRRTSSPNAGTIRRHRKFGPLIAGLGILGGLSGPIITFLDKGKVIEYMLHFAGGLTVIILIGLVFKASNSIKGDEQHPRIIHLRLGVLLLLVYFVQIVLGLGIFL